MVDCFEIELTNSHGKKRRLGFCFLSEAEAKLWIKQHPIGKVQQPTMLKHRGL